MSRRTGVVVAVVAALSMMGGSWAWACTAVPTIMVDAVGSSASSRAPATQGSALIIRGNAVKPNAPVTVRWNAMDGPVIGVGTAGATGSFKIDGAVPATAPGVYYLVAGIDGVGVARTAFEVTGAAGEVSDRATAPIDLWPGSPTGTASGGTGATMVLGLGLLGAGLVVVFGGVAVVTVGRRSKPVSVR